MKKRDIILCTSIVAIALIALILIEFGKEEGAYVVITVGGEEIARYNLSDDGEYSLNNGTNILKIEDGKAWMIYANCPKIKGDCTRDGKISKTGEFIACLPNKLTVTVYGAESDVELVG